MKNGKINWFGEEKNKSKTKINSNSINFLGTGKPQNSLKRNIPQNVNFLGLKTKKSKNYKMTPSYMFKKESTKKRRLSKWGDADLDGTPNYFDCDPRNAFKDAKEPKKRESIFKRIKRRVIEGKGYYSPLKEEKVKAERAIERRKRMKEYYTKKEKGYAGEDLTKEEVTEKAAAKKMVKTLTSIEKRAAKKQRKISAAEKYAEKVKELMKVPGLQGAKALARYEIEEKIRVGKKPSQKEMEKLVKFERKTRKFGDIQIEGKISREILPALPGGQIARVLTGAAVAKGGEYSKALKAKSARVRRMTDFAVGAVFGPSLTRTSFDSEPRGRGRPPGPSGEYKIGGKPVYEEEFQQYSIKQNKLNTMLPSEAQSASLNPEYIAYMKAKAAAERVGMGEGQTINPELARARQNQMMTEEGYEMEGEMPIEETEMPTTGTSMMQSGQQQELIKQKRAYTQALPEEIKMAQQQAQRMDNILSAPNFMKGELKATGGSILTPIGPSILEAPNSFKGEMRNVTKPNINEGEVRLGERPQVNFQGSEYLELDLMSNKPMIKTRKSEKWMTGEAL